MTIETTRPLTLFYQPECHLCEEAEELVHELDLDRRITRVNIEDDLELLKRYGFSVPVLLREGDGRELSWPFGAGELAEFAGVTRPRSDPGGT